MERLCLFDRRERMKEPLPVQPVEERVLDLYERILADVPEDMDSFAGHVARLELQRRERWQLWIDNSDTDWFYWRVCQKLVAAHEPLELVSTPLLTWIYQVALGSRREPKMRGRPPHNRARNIVIAQLVQVIESCGYRRATSSNEGGSACHLVADRLDDLDYVSVRTIWKRERITKVR